MYFKGWISGFFKSNTFRSNARLKLAENKQILSKALRLNFWHLKIICIFHPCYQTRYKQKNKCTCIHEIMRLIILKMKKKDHMGGGGLHYPYSGWAFSKLLTDGGRGGAKRAPSIKSKSPTHILQRWNLAQLYHT